MIAVDTSVLVSAEGLGVPARTARLTTVLMAVRRSELVVPAQAVAELFRVLRAKTMLGPDEVRERPTRWLTFASVAPTMETTVEAAVDIAADHGLQSFDAIMLAAAPEAGCLLLSEDMQDGFVWRGVTIANPFAANLHPLLADLLAS